MISIEQVDLSNFRGWKFEIDLVYIAKSYMNMYSPSFSVVSLSDLSEPSSSWSWFSDAFSSLGCLFFSYLSILVFPNWKIVEKI